MITRQPNTLVENLRARWDEVDVALINTSFQTTGTAESPFGYYEGLCDFRGFQLKAHLKLSTIAMSGKKPIPQTEIPATKRLDFSFSIFSRGGFSDVVAEDCKFDGVEIGANWRRCFRRCSFKGAKLSRNYLTGRFEDCDFLKAELNSSSAGATDSFVRCNFTKANFRSANWVQVRFENCIFDGAKFDRASVSGSRFIGTAPSEEQLKDTLVAKVVYEDVPCR